MMTYFLIIIITCERQSVSAYTSVTNSYIRNAQMKIECVQISRENIGLSWCIPKQNTFYTYTHRIERDVTTHTYNSLDCKFTFYFYAVYAFSLYQVDPSEMTERPTVIIHTERQYIHIFSFFSKQSVSAFVYRCSISTKSYDQLIRDSLA